MANEFTLYNRETVIPFESAKYRNVFPEEYESFSKEEKKKYVYDEDTRTYSLDDLIWKKQRQHWTGYESPTNKDYVEYTVTGSEAGSIAVASEVTKHLFKKDVHVYRCKSDLWMEKRGVDIPLKTERISKDLAIGGHMMEEITAKALSILLSRMYPNSVWEVKRGEKMYQCGAKKEDGSLLAPWLIATPDGFVYRNGEIVGLAEFKNIQSFSPNATLIKEGIVPAEYYTQIQHYLMATNLRKCYFIAALGNSFPSDFKVIPVERDDVFCDALYEAEDEFVDSLEKGIMPAMDGSDGQDMKQIHDLLRKKMGNYKPVDPVLGDASLIEAAEEIDFINEKIEALKTQIASLEEQRMALLVKDIFPVVKDANELLVPVGCNSYYMISLKSEKPTQTIEPEEVKSLYPDVYEDCCEKKFSATLLKKGYPEIHKQLAKVSDAFTDTKKNYFKMKVVAKK